MPFLAYLVLFLLLSAALTWLRVAGFRRRYARPAEKYSQPTRGG